MPPKTKRTTRTRSKGSRVVPPAFLVGGALVFLVGGGGLLYWLWLSFTSQLVHIFPDTTVLYAQVHLSSSNLGGLPKRTDRQGLLSTVDTITQDLYSFQFSTDILPWVGSRAGLAITQDGSTVLALRYRNRLAARQFLNQFLAQDESMTTIPHPRGDILTPEFSSTIAFSFHQGWLLISTTTAALQEVLNDTPKLADNPDFQKVDQDLPRNAFFRSYVNTAAAVKQWGNRPSLRDKRPLLNSLATITPAAGFTLQAQDDSLQLSLKVLTHKGVFDENKAVRQTSETLIPELASYAPKDALLFANGADLYQKYRHTLTFLGELHPQFPIIFQGLLRAQGRRFFGPQFDFEKDFLQKTHGQYAFILNFADATDPFVNLTFVTAFGGNDREQSLSLLHDSIQYAQGQFQPQVQTTTLPDGSIRQELVATPPEQIPIKKIEIEGAPPYYTARTGDTGASFSYGFIDRYLVLSTQEAGVRSVFSSVAQPTNSLANNEDFRDAVMWQFSPSESYGFLNAAKLATALDYLLGTPAEVDQSPTRTFLSFFRTISFARKVHPGATFLTAILQLR